MWCKSSKKTHLKELCPSPGCSLLPCLWARAMGFPIDRIVLAHNANRTVPDYLRTSQWQPRPSIATLASAMDVGNPSNMERLTHLFPDASSLNAAVTADTVDDDAIRKRIRAGGQFRDPRAAPPVPGPRLHRSAVEAPPR